MGLVYSEPACQSAYNDDVYQLYHILKENPTKLNALDPGTGDTPLIAACRRGNLKVVEYLLKHRADVSITNKKQRSCLHYVSRRRLSLLDYLLISILMPILLLGYFLMLQKQRNCVNLMNAVLSTDVNVDAIDYKGNTALHYVCQRKNHRLVLLLLEKKAKTDIKNNDGETPLDIANRLKVKNIIFMLKKTE
ncbi:ankyrin repeat domain-containing protein 22 [Thalassophryne amazonica]|uniref:ankyrin repeat domain-containing protein 22 n=1 Tax=Thalassophryne amazonica TaxID=390379 RepID=UPI001470C3B0|nr:ankyrin repeat domain-containing protein 22 [Thalassophryne amazonica]